MSWRRLRTLLRREVRATLRDPFTLAAMIGVPLVALLLFGFTIATDVHDMKLAVLDADDSAESRRLVADLAANGTFDVHHVVSRAAIDRGLVGGSFSAGLIIPPAFSRDLRGAATGGPAPEVQVVYDGGEAVLAGNAELYLRALVATTGAQLAVTPGPRAPGGPAPGISVAMRALFNPRLDGKPYMVAGTFGFVLSFLTTLITAVSIVNERINGTFEQLQVTPATSVEILLGKILPLGAVFAFDVCVMVIVAGLVMGVWPQGSILFFVLVSAVYVAVSLSLGLIFSATSATPAEAVQKTVLFSIPLVQLSGFAFPIRNMPAIVRWIAELFPATHYIRVSRAIYIRGSGPIVLFPELCLIVLFGAAFVVVAARTIGARQ